MFVFKASRYLEELEKNYPEILKNARESVSDSKKDMDFTRLMYYTIGILVINYAYKLLSKRSE